MPRTTVNLDPSARRDLKRLVIDEGKSLGDVVSQLLAPVLAKRTLDRSPAAILWQAAPMGPPTVGMEDK